MSKYNTVSVSSKVYGNKWNTKYCFNLKLKIVVGMTLAKVKEQDGMTLAKVKEQDGMTLAKVKEQDAMTVTVRRPV